MIFTCKFSKLIKFIENKEYYLDMVQVSIDDYPLRYYYLGVFAQKKEF